MTYVIMKSYLRFLSRNSLYAVIMAVGLSVSLAFVIIMSCYVWQQYRVGRQYPDYENIYILGHREFMAHICSSRRFRADGCFHLGRTSDHPSDAYEPGRGA